MVVAGSLLPALVANRVIDSARLSGASACTTSPSTPSATWLVARIRSLGAAPSRVRASSATGAARCSQLSKISSGSCGAQPVENHRAGAGCQAQRFGDGRPGGGGVVRVLQPDQPAAAARTGRRGPPRPPTGSCRRPAGPTTVTSRAAASSVETRPRSAERPTREPTQGGQVAARSEAVADAGPAVDPDHGAGPAFHRLQLGAWIEAELVGQRVLDPLVRGERVGLPAGPVQRRDRARPRGSRAADERTTSRSSSPMISAPPPRSLRAASWSSINISRASASRARCGSSQPPRPPLGSRSSPRNRASASVQVASVASASPLRRVAPAASASRGTCERVDLVRFERQGVASAVTDQQGGVAQRPAQLRHLGLQRVPADREGRSAARGPRSAGRSARLAGVQREPHQQLARFPGRDPDPEAVAAYLDRPQHGHAQHPRSIGAVRIASADHQRPGRTFIAWTHRP